jgi:hypothetical protein
LGTLDYARKVGANRSGHAEQRFQRWISHSALNVTHHLLGQAGTLSHLVHGKVTLFPLASQDLGDPGAHSQLRFIRCHI